MAGLPEVYLARHGETTWTITRQHTGHTDIPLIARGERDAPQSGPAAPKGGILQGSGEPAGAGSSDVRAGGIGNHAEVDPDLQEWDYGQYEGRRC